MTVSYSRKEIIGDSVLYLGDCADILPTLPTVDGLLTDPPYGIGEAAGKNKSRGNVAVAKDYGSAVWDNNTKDIEIKLAISIATNSIIFGGNYYNLPPTSCWLIWDKQNGNNDFADCEMAWTNLPKAIRRLYWLWNGMIRKGHDIRQHPTQKPVGVMKWCINHFPKGTETILDPFMGVGSTGVACAKLGRKFIGIELDETYFEIACERIQKAYDQPDLFVEPPKPQVQEDMEI